MFCEFPSCDEVFGVGINPARQRLIACGYDQECYISTAGLVPSPYVTQALIVAKIGGLNRLIESVDDSQPPTGSLNPDEPPNNAAYLTYLSVIQNVVTEINGYLSSIYPIPLAQTGTVAIVRVEAVSADGLGTIMTDGTGIRVIDVGNYCVAPDESNSPAYLRHIDPLANVNYFGDFWNAPRGTGASLTVTYADKNYSDESGQVLQSLVISGVPVVADGGLDYKVGDLLVLTGGYSFVPAKIREASLILICHSLYQRRLAPDEKNPFSTLAKFWRGFFAEIGEGEKQLDGTYKRFFSAGASWNTRSVLHGATSL